MVKNVFNKITAAVLLGLMAVPAACLWAADDNQAVSVTADKLVYDGKNQIATATGNVVIIRGQSTINGDKAVYNLKTSEADIEGNVVAQQPQPNMYLTSDKLHSENQNYIVATGSVRGTYEDKKVNGDKVEYYIDKNYGIVTGNGYLEAEGGRLWGDRIDAWFKEVKAVGEGRVHIEFPADNLTADADKAVYTQTPDQNDGVVRLTGNVNAVQDGNSLKGENVLIRLEDNSAQTTGRSTIVIIPDNP